MKFVPLAVASKRSETLRTDGAASIYALVDPLDLAIRYVGMTRRQISSRVTQHLTDDVNASVGQWKSFLRRQNLKIVVHCLQRVSAEDAPEAERQWIDWINQRGKLLNVQHVRGALKVPGPKRLARKKQNRSPASDVKAWNCASTGLHPTLGELMRLLLPRKSYFVRANTAGLSACLAFA